MILAVLQARMSSTRLPGKVLRPVAGAPMLVRQIERVRRAARLDALVVATSVDASDDGLAETLAAFGVAVHRGSLHDVLDRFAGALRAHPGTEHVVRLTGDCPVTDWRVIDAVVERHLAEGADYTSNVFPRRTYPKGLDVEIVRADALLAAADAPPRSAGEREHVTIPFYTAPDRYRIASVEQAADQGHLWWTVDTPSDHDWTAQVYAALYPDDPAFGPAQISRLLDARADLRDLGGVPRWR